MLPDSTFAFFHDSLNDSSSATPNCFSRSFLRAVHNWTGKVVGFMSGQIFSWATNIFIMSLCHAQPQCLYVMKAKIHFIDFRYWQFELTCWSAYSNHTKSSLCRLFTGPIPYRGIIHFPAQNEHPLLYQMNQSLQHLLVCYHIYDVNRGPLYLTSNPHYILWFHPSILLLMVLYNPSTL